MPLMRSLQTIMFDAKPNYRGETILVDDGSGDGSLKELRLIQVEFPAVVTIIRLTRNFGQAGALLAGYGHARGKCVVTLIGEYLWRTLTQVRAPRYVSHRCDL